MLCCVLLVVLSTGPAPLGAWQSSQCLLLQAANSSPGQGENWAHLHQNNVVGGPWQKAVQGHWRAGLCQNATRNIQNGNNRFAVAQARTTSQQPVLRATCCPWSSALHWHVAQSWHRANHCHSTRGRRAVWAAGQCLLAHPPCSREVMCSSLVWNIPGSSSAAFHTQLLLPTVRCHLTHEEPLGA